MSTKPPPGSSVRAAENPDSLPAAMRLTANHYLRIGEKQKALNLASKLQAANQTNPDILGVLAQAQFANDQKQAALESYQRLANLLPDSAAVQLQIAAIQMALRNGAGAAEAVKKALAIQPDSLNAEVAQASLFMLEKAIKFKQLILQNKFRSKVARPRSDLNWKEISSLVRRSRNWPQRHMSKH